MAINPLDLYDALILAGLPVIRVEVIDAVAIPPNMLITYRGGATPEQRTQGADINNRFDWSQSGQDERQALRERESVFENVDQRESAKTILIDVGPFSKMMRAILSVTLDEINSIRASVSLPPRTFDQFKTAVQTAVDSGRVDSGVVAQAEISDQALVEPSKGDV